MLKDRAVEVRVASLQADTRQKLESMGCKVEVPERGLTTVRLSENQKTYDAVDILKATSVEIIEIRPQKETLEELFIRTVKEEVA